MRNFRAYRGGGDFTALGRWRALAQSSTSSCGSGDGAVLASARAALSSSGDMSLRTRFLRALHTPG